MTKLYNQITQKYQRVLSTRARDLVNYHLSYQYPDLDNLLDDLENAFSRVESWLLRIPGVGRTTINELLQALEVERPEGPTKTAIVRAVYDDRRLTKEDVRLIRKLMAAQLSLVEEGPMANHIRALREKLPL